MKKTLILLSAVTGLLFTSCKKEEDKKDTPARSTWTIDGKSRTSASTTKYDNSYSFTAAGLASISFTFKEYPTKNGTWLVMLFWSIRASHPLCFTIVQRGLLSTSVLTAAK